LEDSTAHERLLGHLVLGHARVWSAF
jgi:hypothetical protein